MRRFRPAAKALLWVVSVVTLIYLATSETRWAHSSGSHIYFDDPWFELALLYVLLSLLLTVWAASLLWRLSPGATRRLLMAQVVMLGIWVVLKLLKLTTPLGVGERYIWYLYYLPTLGSACVAVMVAHRVVGSRRRWHQVADVVTMAVSVALLVLIVTNDLHRLVFRFPDGIDMYHTVRGATLVQAFVIVWQLGCLLYAIGTMFVGAWQRPFSLPLAAFFVAVTSMVTYSVLYAADVWLLRDTETVAITSILMVLAWELAIASGLIRANRGYLEAMHLTTVPVYVLNRADEVVERSAASTTLAPDMITRVLTAPGMRLQTSGERTLDHQATEISAGHVLMVSDVSELVALTDQLSAAREDLRRTHRSLTRQQAAGVNAHMAVVRNELGRELDEFLTQRLEKTEQLTEQLPLATSAEQQRTLLRQIEIELAFTKAETMVMLLTSGGETIGLDQLASYLGQCCIDFSDPTSFAGVHFQEAAPVEASAALRLLAFFHEVFAHAVTLGPADVMVQLNAVDGGVSATSMWDFESGHEHLFDGLLTSGQLASDLHGGQHSLIWDEPTFRINFAASAP